MKYPEELKELNLPYWIISFECRSYYVKVRERDGDTKVEKTEAFYSHNNEIFEVRKQSLLQDLYDEYKYLEE